MRDPKALAATVRAELLAVLRQTRDRIDEAIEDAEAGRKPNVCGILKSRGPMVDAMAARLATLMEVSPP